METPRSEQFDDIYFAVENGLEESRYVFLEQNHLPAAFVGKSRFTICETGFGTGLNFLCAWSLFEEHAVSDQQLTYVSFEKYPLSASDISKYLNHWSSEFGGRLERLIDVYPMRIGGWHKIRVSPQVTLLLIFDDVNRALPQLDEPVDCWFLDGHAPAKNPDMWSESLFHEMGRLSLDGASVATFTAAGFVRRGLEAAGFEVSKVKGYGHKRDMIVGVFKGSTLSRHLVSFPRKVAVIGGGIAGTSLSYILGQRGVDVDLFDPQGLGKGASGNERGLFNPRFTALKGNESDFYSPAFQHSRRIFEDISKDHDIGYEACGSLHLVIDEAKRKRMNGFLEHWGWHDQHAYFMDQDKVREMSGIRINHDALFLPDAGLVSPLKIVKVLGRTANLIEEKVLSVIADGSGWIVNGRSYDAVVFSCAVHVIGFEELNWLPVSNVRGQVSLIEVPELFQNLSRNLCYGGYCSKPYQEGNSGDSLERMVVGSTFQPWLQDASV
ncbi:MAG TPA: tRNA (5-methylaminomethyl-2-thiouridine)(34)-methyltransferase MnmD, partial [Alphaproteobacteria bacterium]|nr:tRNA (5-methylaminomethyl-2-thiouridine)(34)-methyltransferase MnmD [Alphaproteobacteria bacterium]